MNGYIKLLRKFLNWEWYTNQNTKDLFIHCLLKANWEDKKFEGMIIKRGSFITSLDKLSNELGFSISQLRTALRHLISTNDLAIKTTNKYRVITVINYDTYQVVDKQNDNQLANNSQANDNQLATTNKLKEEKEINIYTTTNNSQTIFDFVEENFGRPLSPIEFEEICKWSDTDLTRYAIKQAVLNGKYSIKYISKILYEWQKKNIKTVQEAQRNEEEWNRQKRFSKGQNVAPVPDWFYKEFEEEEMTEDERRELEEIKNGTYKP